MQGQNYYSALGSSITSSQALANPFNANITLGSNHFLHNPFLKRTITDTHFDNPDRRGRLVTFLARLVTDSAAPQLAIASDEYTAVCIDETGLAKVFGSYPTHDDNAYFIATNCDIVNNIPETCMANTTLTWSKNNAALRVYKIKGTANANNSFNVNDFKTATGGVWQYWYVNNGVFAVDSTNATAPVCSSVLAIKNDDKNSNISASNKNDEIVIYPNPFINIINLQLQKNITQINIYNSLGMIIQQQKFHFQEGNTSFKMNDIKSKFYVVEIVYRTGKRMFKKLVKQ